MHRKLTRYGYILLLLAAVMSLAACGGKSNDNDVREISDLQMALLCDVVYRDELDTFFENGQELFSDTDSFKSPIRDDYLENMADRNLPAELSGFMVVDFDHGDITGFRAAAFKKNNNIVIAYCGTEDFADIVSDLGVATFDFSSQDNQAKQFAKDNIKEYADCNIYVTGYSMGGRLAYLGAETIVDTGHDDKLMRVCTFNGLGVKEALDFSDSNLSNIHGLETIIKDITVNHIVKGDDVSDDWIKNDFGLLHIGEEVYYDCTNPQKTDPIKVMDVEVDLIKHDLYTFIDALSKYSIVNDETSTVTDTKEDERGLVQDFDIVGTWQSVGESGFGQAQPGAIVTFDTDTCNFYSPNDTYELYQQDGKIILECTSYLFSETLSFDVDVLDDNNVVISYGSTVTTLTRVNSAGNNDNYSETSGTAEMVPSGTYYCTDGSGQVFTFYDNGTITMSAFGIQATGSYEIADDKINIRYNFLGEQLWSPSFSMNGESLFIAGAEFVKL